MWIVMIKSLRYYIKSLCIKKCHTLMKFRISTNNALQKINNKINTNNQINHILNKIVFFHFCPGVGSGLREWPTSPCMCFTNYLLNLTPINTVTK